MRARTYFSHAWQKYDEWEVLYAGDMGAQSTKFGFFNTRQVKFNTGQNFSIICNKEKAPDSVDNCKTAFCKNVATGIEGKNKSCV